jgi:hypothetical protein
LLSIVNNTCSSLVTMEPQRKPNFWTIDFEWQALQWTLFVGKMMTFSTWHVFWNGGVVRLLWTTPRSLEKTQYVKTKVKWIWT